MYYTGLKNGHWRRTLWAPAKTWITILPFLLLLLPPIPFLSRIFTTAEFAILNELFSLIGIPRVPYICPIENPSNKILFLRSKVLISRKETDISMIRNNCKFIMWTRLLKFSINHSFYFKKKQTFYSVLIQIEINLRLYLDVSFSCLRYCSSEFVNRIIIVKTRLSTPIERKIKFDNHVPGLRNCAANCVKVKLLRNGFARPIRVTKLVNSMTQCEQEEAKFNVS